MTERSEGAEDAAPVVTPSDDGPAVRAIAGFVSLDGPRRRDWLTALGRRMTASEVYVSPGCRVMFACAESADSVLRHGRDGATALAFMGEVYRVGGAARQAAGRSDADRFLEAVRTRADRPEAALADLDGAYAAAWHDTRTGRVVIARDQFGMKPLYWAVVDAVNGLVFATDVAALFLSGLIEPAVDPLDFVYRSYCRMEATDSFSWYAGIRSVPPASLLEIADGKAAVRRYWQPGGDQADVAPEDVRAAFLKAVEMRSHGARRAAAVLSGGVDSSAVFCSLSDLGRDVTPYVVQYEGWGVRQNTDVPYALLAARSRGRVAQRCEVGTDDLSDIVDRVVARVHRPFVHGVEVALYQTYRRMAADGHLIAFSGHASDSCWGDQDGSDFPILDIRGPVDIHSEFYLKNRIYRDERPLWHTMLDRIMRHLEVDEADVTDRVWERIFDLYRDFPGLDPHKRARHHIVGKFGGYVNELVEACTSAFGITERTPFQDVELVELSFRMPEYVKNHDGLTDMKPFLKQALAEILPREIVHRPKQGFPPPDDAGFAERLRRLVADVGTPFDAEFTPAELNSLGIGELLYLYSAQSWLRHAAALSRAGRRR